MSHAALACDHAASSHHACAVLLTAVHGLVHAVLSASTGSADLHSDALYQVLGSRRQAPKDGPANCPAACVAEGHTRHSRGRPGALLCSIRGICRVLKSLILPLSRLIAARRHISQVQKCWLLVSGTSQAHTLSISSCLTRTCASTRVLFLLQVRIRNDNDLVIAGHAVIDVSITQTSSVDASTFIVEGKLGAGGEEHTHLSRSLC